MASTQAARRAQPPELTEAAQVVEPVHLATVLTAETELLD